MKKNILLLLVVILFFSCSKNLFTGSKHLKLVSEIELQTVADSEYKTFLNANSVVSSTDNNAEMVRYVGTGIASTIKKYYDAKGQNSVLEEYLWQFNLVNNKEVYAWLYVLRKRGPIYQYIASHKNISCIS